MTDGRAHFIPWSHWLRQTGLSLAWLLLTVYFHSPAREVLTPTLDGSNFASYAYFTAHGFQYGFDVVPMAGPYGFVMYGWTYGGDLFWLRTACELILNGALAAFTLWFVIAYRRHWLVWVWLAAHVAFTPFIEDLPIEWLLLLAGFYSLHKVPAHALSPQPFLATGLIAFLSLVKGTQFFLGIATLAVVLGGHLAQGRRRHAIRLAAAYAGFLLLFWCAARQNPLNLPAYVRGMIELGGGYTDAMSLDAPSGILVRGLLVSAGLASGLLWALWRRRSDPVAVASLLMLAGYSFMEWKHGFVRADGHAYIYFHYAVVAAATLHVIGAPPACEPSRRIMAAARLVPMLATIAAACLGGDQAMLPNLRKAPQAAWTRFMDKARYLGSLPETKTRLELQLAQQRELEALPAVREQIGRQTIDLFGYQHGLIPLNGLNYHPRPMGGGSFNAYTPALMRLNREFLRDPDRRPDYYLVSLRTIDARLPAQDDGLALLEIIRRYQPVLLEREHLLMKAMPAGEAADPRLIGSRTFRFGAPVEVPAVGPDEILLARFRLHNNWRGWLRSLLYKTPALSIDLLGDEGAALGSYRLIPSMSASPFVFSPLLEDVADLTNLYDGTAGRTVRRFTLRTRGQTYFVPELGVEFFACARPPPADRAVLEEAGARLKFPFANLEPESITPAFRPHKSVRFLHAPAEAVWPLRAGDRAVSFEYGLDPQAYDPGTSNGVEFIVEIRGPAGGTTRVFSRLLRPRSTAADRGRQAARLTLPIHAAGSRLVLRTDPGEFGDNAWDWSYFTRMEIRPGRFEAAQFPGFNRVPDQAEGEHAGVIDFEGRKLLMLHVPGSVSFAMNGRERKLALDFGFLPGAYAHGGQTPGADYIVELLRGGEARELFRRALRPVAEPADRGPQAATISLPALEEGDSVRLRIAAPPGAGNSWGWTYVSRLLIE